MKSTLPHFTLLSFVHIHTHQANWFEYIKGSSIHYTLDQQLDHISSCVYAETARYTYDDYGSETPNRNHLSTHEKTIIIGHSIGSYIGIEALRRNPDNVCAFLGIMVRA
jgi:pimeloyl-ACP methyl ester carboxylesterase